MKTDEKKSKREQISTVKAAAQSINVNANVMQATPFIYEACCDENVFVYCG